MTKRKLEYPRPLDKFNWQGRKVYEMFQHLGLRDRTWEHYASVTSNPIDNSSTVRFFKSKRTITVPHWRARTAEENYGFAVQAYMELKNDADFT